MQSVSKVLVVIAYLSSARHYPHKCHKHIFVPKRASSIHFSLKCPEAKINGSEEPARKNALALLDGTFGVAVYSPWIRVKLCLKTPRRRRFIIFIIGHIYRIIRSQGFSDVVSVNILPNLYHSEKRFSSSQ